MKTKLQKMVELSPAHAAQHLYDKLFDEVNSPSQIKEIVGVLKTKTDKVKIKV